MQIRKMQFDLLDEEGKNFTMNEARHGSIYDAHKSERQTSTFSRVAKFTPRRKSRITLLNTGENISSAEAKYNNGKKLGPWEDIYRSRGEKKKVEKKLDPFFIHVQ